MIYEINIQDPKGSDFEYINNLTIPKKIEFTKNHNILIGKNGSGKSTILNILKNYTLCNSTFSSKHLQYPFLYDKLVNGISVISDYKRATFNLRTSELIPHEPKIFMEDLKNNVFQSTKNSKCSKGEFMLYTMRLLFNEMFGEDSRENLVYPIETICKYENNDSLKRMGNYIKKNHKESDCYTILMDEPTSNLDIVNIEEIYKILTHRRDDVQIICSLHDPILIYELSQIEDINIIELTKGYLDEIKKYLENFKIFQKQLI